MTEPIEVLHVEDDASFADLTSTFLERADERFAVQAAVNPSEGLDRLHDEEFDCIVSDYDMPERDGIEFLKAVRERDRNLPFILFTGKGSEEVASEAISAGATDYIQKQPGSEQYELLANRIKNAVTRSRSEKAVEQSEQRYHNLVDTAPIPIMLFDSSGKTVYANEEAIEFLNAESFGDVEGDPFTNFLQADDQATAQKRFERLIEEEIHAPEIEYRVRAVDGEEKTATVATAYGYYKGDKVAQSMILP